MNKKSISVALIMVVSWAFDYSTPKDEDLTVNKLHPIF